MTELSPTAQATRERIASLAGAAAGAEDPRKADMHLQQCVSLAKQVAFPSRPQSSASPSTQRCCRTFDNIHSFLMDAHGDHID